MSRQSRCMRILSSTSGNFARGLWSRMQAALRRFMPRMPSSRRRRAAVNSQYITPPEESQPRNTRKTRKKREEVFLVFLSCLSCVSWFDVFLALRRLRRVAGRLQEVTEAEQLHQPVAGVPPDQQLAGHHQPERLGEAEQVPGQHPPRQ